MTDVSENGNGARVQEEQLTLFDMPPKWIDLWQGMPEFEQVDAAPFDSISVQFRHREDRIAFLAMMGEPLDRRRSIWYPKMSVQWQSQRCAPATVVELVF